MTDTGDSYPNSRFLTETDWLAAHLEDPGLRIFDCTTYLFPHRDPKRVFRIVSGRDDWRQGHVPGSGFIDLDEELSDPASPLPYTNPPAEQFARVMSAHGVGNDSRVVFYSAGVMQWATRAWWMLRAFGFDNVSVLNGGLQKWRAENRPLSTLPCAYPPGEFTPRPRPEFFADKQRVLGAIGADDMAIVNALSADQHRGEAGLHYGRRGHIKCSVNVPASEVVDEHGNEILPAEELRRRFAAVGALDAAQAIFYCGGGIAATLPAFALALIGHEHLAVYDASLFEWARDGSLPMEAGE